jgi:hypothetical protein
LWQHFITAWGSDFGLDKNSAIRESVTKYAPFGTFHFLHGAGRMRSVHVGDGNHEELLTYTMWHVVEALPGVVSGGKQSLKKAATMVSRYVGKRC